MEEKEKREEFARMFDELCAVYPDRIVPRGAQPSARLDVMRAWYRILGEIPVDVLRSAIDNLAEAADVNVAYPPNAYQIKRHARQMAGVVRFGEVNAAQVDQLRGEMFRLTQEFYSGDDLEAVSWERLIDSFRNTGREHAAQHAEEVYARLVEQLEAA